MSRWRSWGLLAAFALEVEAVADEGDLEGVDGVPQGMSEFRYLFSGSLLGLSCARFFNIQFVLQLISFYR